MALSKKFRLRIAIVAAFLLLLLLLYHGLLSSLMIRNVWLPMVKSRTGIDVQAETCRISLFSSPTFYAENAALKTPQMKVAAKNLTLSANPVGFLFSRKLTVSELRGSGFVIEYAHPGKSVTPAGPANDPLPETRSSSQPKREETLPTAVPEEKKDSLNIAIQKVELTDSSLLIRDAQGGSYEFSGLSIFCSDLFPAGRASIRFESAFRMESEQMEIARTPVSGNARVDFVSDSLIPSGIEAEFSSGTMTLSGKRINPLGAAFSMRLNAGWNGEQILVRSSSLRLKDGAGAEVLKADLNGGILWKTLSGRLSASLKTTPSALLDSLIRAYTGKTWKNAVLTANVTASVAEAGDAVVAEGNADLSADSLFEEIRSIGSRFSFRAMRRENGLEWKTLQFHLRDGSGKLNLSAWTSPDFSWLCDFREKTLTGSGTLELQTVNLNLPRIAGLLELQKRFPVKSGLFSLALKAKPAGKQMALTGRASLNEFLVSAKGEGTVLPMDLSSTFSMHAMMNPPGVVLDSCRLTGMVRQKKFLSADLRCSAPDLKTGFPMSAELFLSELNEQVLGALPFSFLRNGKIRAFKTEMNVKWERGERDVQTLSLSGTVDGLSIAGAEQPLELALGSRLSLAEDRMRLDALSLTASEQHRDFLDLNLSGNVEPEAAQDGGRNRFLLASKFIDAAKLQNLALLLKNGDESSAASANGGVLSTPSAGTSQSPAGGAGAVSHPAPVVPPKEPAPLDFSAWQGILEFALEKIQYTDDVVLSLHGPLEIDGSRIAAEALKLTANGAPVNLRFALDAGFADGYEYALAFSMKNLLLPPLIKAAMKGRDQGVTGTLSSVDLKMEGKGVTPQNFKKNLKGSVKASTADLSFPAPSADVIDALNLLFIPLDAVPDLTESLNLDALTGDLKTLSDNVSGILDGSKNVEFERGTMDVSVSDGIVILNKFLFEGGTLKSESVAGKVNLLTGGLDLAASLNLGILVIPMKIGGTLSGPKPDFKEFLVQFAEKNVENLLDPDNIENTIQNVDSILQLFRRKKKK